MIAKLLLYINSDPCDSSGLRFLESPMKVESLSFKEALNWLLRVVELSLLKIAGRPAVVLLVVMLA